VNRLRSRLAGLMGRVLLLTFGLACAVAISEAGLFLFLTHPTFLRWAPSGLAANIRYYYMSYDRALLQAQPEASRYDRELFYTLRPGAFHFRNREYDVEVRVNQAGVRDDAASLQAPEIIVLGDSLAMGWGVGQSQSFPEQLARLTGRKVLDAGIASYGTVRERRLLDRLDTSAMKWLVIQYDANDAVENAAFRDQGNVLHVQPRVVYHQTLEQAAQRRRYWPGKATFCIVRHLLGLSGERPPTVFHPVDEAAVFLNALEHAGTTPLDGVQVLVVPINAFDEPVSPFCEEVVQQIGKRDCPSWMRRMIVLDLTGTLRREHYFDLDDHINAAGHRVVAQAIQQALFGR
jgi:lysophospholipase L1-like esterase